MAESNGMPEYIITCFVTMSIFADDAEIASREAAALVKRSVPTPTTVSCVNCAEVPASVR
jgi:hypothetical protein